MKNENPEKQAKPTEKNTKPVDKAPKTVEKPKEAKEAKNEDAKNLPIRTLTIVATGKKGTRSESTMVELAGVFTNGKLVPFSELLADDKWAVNKYGFLCTKKDTVGKVAQIQWKQTFDTEIVLVFNQHKWGGIVEITLGDQKVTLNTYAPEYNRRYVSIYPPELTPLAWMKKLQKELTKIKEVNL